MTTRHGGPKAVRPAGAGAGAAPDTGSDGAEPLHLPLLEATETEPRPTWRGWLHAGTTPIAIAAGIVLVCLANGTEAKWASAVFGLTSLLLFGNSALYHRFDWSPKTKRLLKRIDHSNIFLLIAGTYTPLSLLGLPPSTGVPLIVVVWSVALLGIAFRVFWIGAPRWLYVLAYLALGWAAVSQFPALYAANPAMLLLFVVGGAFYTVGAIAYAVKRPNPFPGRFGFHEVFHTCTVIAFFCHWAATLLIALHPVA